MRALPLAMVASSGTTGFAAPPNVVMAFVKKAIDAESMPLLAVLLIVPGTTPPFQFKTLVQLLLTGAFDQVPLAANAAGATASANSAARFRVTFLRAWVVLIFMTGWFVTWVGFGGLGGFQQAARQDTLAPKLAAPTMTLAEPGKKSFVIGTALSSHTLRRSHIPISGERGGQGKFSGRESRREQA